ncbi:uncharacterized protein LACBIDRAFT_309823 [Laccaria bicolor S238N-H82]|uniref:Predicted protein n=1 Tax=Laccaria bicolor (strain S238N-H82 / ATCC MYA-4686) TaxID=486041 RepID=B0DT52_LACBS|nr:uncharacterized protein LACBIDRAFT_309823 [Laccaria bicolor S238N-H82]EDR02216.1 predicted protein [Laccaria bicolor S238N-H82]|eukprot:XP_001887161.1 predicted protein [Laccaria bicolor S238N-H82]
MILLLQFHFCSLFLSLNLPSNFVISLVLLLAHSSPAVHSFPHLFLQSLRQDRRTTPSGSSLIVVWGVICALKSI